jgi:caffeoyl-CoA O-methyltransferase
MSRSTLQLTPELAEYLAAINPPLDEVQRDLVAETARATGGAADMQIAPDQGALMTLLTRLVGAQFAVELGTFTGYSSLAIARGLAPGGRLLCCDVSEEWTSIARRYWERAGVADRIELRLAPAIETLKGLPEEPVIDISFLDADKEGYVAYWEELVPRTRRGGLFVVDNVLSAGRVLEAEHPSASVQGIRAFNEHIRRDSRVEFVALPLADGVTIAQRV